MLRDATPDDMPALLALNAASVEVLSPLDEARLVHLRDEAAACRVIETDGVVRAFVLTFRDGADYDSENYRWFDAHYPTFLYIDRVVVDRQRRRAGLGSQLSADVFAQARAAGVTVVACEYDVEPANPASERFHARHGFREVAQQRVASGKRVSLQVVELRA